MDRRFSVLGELLATENRLNKLQEIVRDIRGFAQWGLKTDECLPITEHITGQLDELVAYVEKALRGCCGEEEF